MSTEQLRLHARQFNDGSDVRYRVPTPEEVRDFYDENGGLLSRLLGGSMHYGYWTGPDDDSSFEVAAARLTDLMIEKLTVKPDHMVLDLGCGQGGPAVRLSRATGAKVVGVSISAGDVASATALAEADGLAGQVQFQCANALALPFPAESFDAVLALESIVHVLDRAHVLAEVRRVLKPAGRLALTDFVTHATEAERGTEGQVALAEMLAAWRAAPLVHTEDYPELVRRAGLVIDEVEDITENTKFTFPRTFAAMRAHIEQYGELPPDLARIYAFGADIDWSELVDAPATEGTIIVVAHRPAEPT